MFHVLRANESHGVEMTSNLMYSCCILANFLKDVDPDGLPSWEESVRVEHEHQARTGRLRLLTDPEEGVLPVTIEAQTASARDRYRLFLAWCNSVGVVPTDQATESPAAPP